MNYVLLSAVGKHRSWCLDEFIKYVRNLNPPPDDIILCVDVDSGIDIPYDDVKVLYSCAIEYYVGHVERVARAKEVLRKAFIYHPKNYQYALWLDCDILVPPELPMVMKEVMDKKQCMVVVNKYQGRGDSMWCGGGVVLTERNACTMSRWQVSYYYEEDGTEHRFSEDLQFFAMFDQGSNFTKRTLGKSGRTCDEFVSVIHLLDHSDMKSLER